AHALAPGANIVVVEAASTDLNSLLHAVDVARNQPGVVAVSMSWGGNEFPGESSYDGYFTTPAGHNGITFVNASGDSSAFAGAQWPSTSPNALSVGGTSLYTDAAGDFLGEAGWYGSGGGYSNFESEPSYQSGVQSSGVRTFPDVAAVGDPLTGVWVYSMAPSTGQGGWQAVGGTSVGAPIWAGLIAVADQGRSYAGTGSLDGASQPLPALHPAASYTFHQPVSGYNGYSVQSGYNLVTGLGSPGSPTLIAALVTYSGQSTIGDAAISTGATSTPSTAERSTASVSRFDTVQGPVVTIPSLVQTTSG